MKTIVTKIKERDVKNQFFSLNFIDPVHRKEDTFAPKRLAPKDLQLGSIVHSMSQPSISTTDVPL